jgi:tripartite-type tricarboxylate transporter receptor subunit TctC
VRKAWAAQGTTALTMTVDEFTRYMQDDIAKWTRIVRAANLKPE